jgi:hypothetical protein
MNLRVDDHAPIDLGGRLPGPKRRDRRAGRDRAGEKIAS